MKLQTKIILISIATVIAIALLSSFGFQQGLSSGFGEMFAASFGIIAMIAGVVFLVTGIILLLASQKEWAQGFLLSGGILLLVGFATCSFMMTNSGI